MNITELFGDKKYESPAIEMIAIDVEKGFATSQVTGTGNAGWSNPTWNDNEF